MKMKMGEILMLGALCLFAASGSVQAHCEIPCGIYDDDMRFDMIDEHIDTIEKSVKKIAELSGTEGGAADANQLMRWVGSKEKHADQIREIITQYFMTQKLKTPDESDAGAFAAYTGQLVLMHKMLRTAMKCKQTVDLKNVGMLRTLAHDFKHAYGEAMKK